jgi:hypothetical protein
MSFFKKLNNLNTNRANRNFVSLGINRFIQLGLNINGEYPYDYSGSSISMNAAGNRVAIGAPNNDVEQNGDKNQGGHVRVFSWNGTAWTQLGADIDGEAAEDFSGSSVSMNAAGDRVAIGAPLNDVGGAKVDAGHVRVFSWNGTAWTQLGADIDGEAAGDRFGSSVSMNATGDRVAIGGPSNNVGGAKVDAGHVRVFSWSGTAWTQLGVDIDGEAAGDGFGSSVSMNAVGDRVAIGAPLNDVGADTWHDYGHVRVFSWSGTAWTQLGADIDAEAIFDNFGASVSMNAAGDRVAIGGPYNNGDGIGADAGHVRIFSWSGTAWTQLGADINGEAAGDYFGISVSMNAVGDRVVIGGSYNDGNKNGSDAGHARVFSWNGTAWTQLGVDIDGEAGLPFNYFGISVSMNAAGDRVAIGAHYNDGNSLRAGHVQVYYDYTTSGSMRQVGPSKLGVTIGAEAAGDNFGEAVSMNAVGDRVAIGGTANDGNGSDAGHVRVFRWSGTAWTQLGADIDGEAAGDFFGSFVSMNAVGDRVAIGGLANDVGGTKVNGGHVRVFSWNGTAWTQLGADSDGEAAGDLFGVSVSMNAVGDRVAIGGSSNDVGGTKVNGGHVRVFRWSGTAWTQLGVDIDGEAAGDGFGTSVSMNAVGDRVAIGGSSNDVGGTKVDGGHVRVFRWSGTAWTQLGADIDAEAAGDSFGTSVSMNAAGDRVAIGALDNGVGGTKVYAGHVRVFSWNGTAWTQLGADIDGEAANDRFGGSVSMNAVGDRVAIGASYNDGNGGNAGHVRVFSWNGTAWTQLGVDIDGEAAGDLFGNSVSMNAVGDRVAIGAPFSAGSASIFQVGLLQ